MAERRMFAKTIIDSDAFLEMPITARLLYYDLAMRADDDGFVNSPKKIMKIIGATSDDLGILAARKFIIPFENGVVVIKHWRIHNYIRKDTYKETPYKEEKALLELDENNAYRFSDDVRQLSVDEPLTQVRLGKVRIGKDRIGEVSIEEQITPPTTTNYGEHNLITLSPTEYQGLINLYGEQTVNFTIGNMDNWLYENNRRYSNCYSKLIQWIEGDKKRSAQPKTPTTSTFNNIEQREETDFDKQIRELQRADMRKRKNQ